MSLHKQTKEIYLQITAKSKHDKHQVHKLRKINTRKTAQKKYLISEN